MKDQLRECMIGPLAEYADGFRAEFSSKVLRITEIPHSRSPNFPRG